MGMTRVVLSLVVVFGACTKKAEEPAAKPATAPPTTPTDKPPVAKLPAAKVVVESCTPAKVAVRRGVVGVLRAELFTGGWGYGVSGTGYGSGGSGQGTIGRGEYGTIGHGSPGGSGYSTGAGCCRQDRERMVPRVKIGNATVTGELDKEIIRRSVRQKMAHLQYCYEKQLLGDPSLAGRITVQFIIDGEGNVTKATAAGMGNTEVENCVAGVIRTIKFPKPKDGGFVNVTYPLIFSTEGGISDRRPARPAPKKPKPTPAPAPETPMTKEPVVSPETAAWITEQGPATLRAGLAPLEACYKDSLAYAPTLGGSVTALLIVDAAGKVTAAHASGTGDPGIEGCLATALRATTFPATTAGATMSCAITLGAPATPRPTIFDGTPALTVTADTMTLDGAAVPDFEALAKALKAKAHELEERMTPAREPLRGRVVVRTALGVPVARVVAVLNALADADYLNVALLAETSAGVYAPVPGGSTVPILLDEQASAPRLQLAVVVAANDVWLGVSTGEARTFKDLPGLTAALTELKASPGFKDRTDLQIAAEEKVPYARVIAVLDAVVAAGFTDVALVDTITLAVPYER